MNTTLTTITDARDFAILAHGTQRYGDKPFVHHLDAVANTLKRFGHTDPDLLRAAYLHDVVEDTHVTIDEVLELNGWRVGSLVWALTERPGANHVLKFAATAPKIQAVTGAPTLKLADRIANVEASLTAQDSFIKMYRKEQPLFRQFIYGYGNPLMEAALDTLTAV